VAPPTAGQSTSSCIGNRGEAKRLIAQGGIKVNEEKIGSQDLDVPFDPPFSPRVLVSATSG